LSAQSFVLPDASILQAIGRNYPRRGGFGSQRATSSPVACLAGSSSKSRCCARRANLKIFVTRKKALRHKGFLLFLTPSALSATVSEYHAVANGRDTPDSGRCWSDFWRPLDGENAPIPAVERFLARLRTH